MNNKQSLYLLWSTILNQSQKADQVLNNTKILFKRLNLIDDFEENYKKVTYLNIENAMLTKPTLHRFPKNMSIYLYNSLEKVNKEFNEIKDLFLGTEKEIEERLCSFLGIGKHKAEICNIILNTYLNKECKSSIFNAKCISLLESAELEFKILDELGD